MIWWLVVIFALLLIGAAQLLYLIETLTSGKGAGWKIIWVLVLLFLSVVGAALYLKLAQKDLN